MRRSYSIGKRFLALVLSIAMIAVYLPNMVMNAHAAVTTDSTRITDTSTANSYVDMLGTTHDGNRYSGRIWTDKSVFTGTSVDLGDTGIGTVENDSDFMTVYSALGSTTSVSSTTVVGGSLDVVVILDNSMSMSNSAGSTGNGGPNSNNNSQTRLQAVMEAANTLIDNILANENSRLAVVTYSTGAYELLPLDFYTKGTSNVLTVNSYNSNNGGGKMTATATKADGTTQSNTNNGYQAGTNLQAGVDLAMDILLNAANTKGRAPVIIVLTDGVADTAVSSGWDEVATKGTSIDADTVHPAANTITAGVALSTLLNAAYKTSLVEDKYGANPTVYGVGVDLGSTSDAFVVMDPKTAFNRSFSTLSGTAYGWYEQWLAGTDYTQSETVSRSTYNWDYSLPSGLSASEQTALKADVDANINFVDTYYNVSAAGTELADTFDEIVQSMNQSVFHPITDTQIIGGETTDTPLTYVDFIGDYMEVKDIKAVTLFGEQYSIAAGTATTTEVDNGDGTYTVTKTTPFFVGDDGDMITHPIMNVTTAIADSVTIKLIETYTVRQTDSALIKSSVSDQQLWIYINENALPLVYDEVVVEASGKTSYTRTAAEPVRVYYTVGLTDDIKAEDGTVMTSLVSAEYLAANTAADGSVYFYANQYGQMNGSSVVDADGNVVSRTVDGKDYFYRTGDAHSSATPSEENRYYYHLANQGVFTQVTDTQSADGTVSWEENEFGVEWDADRYELTWMTYAQYQQYMTDLANGTDHQVYTYVSFYRPLETAADDGSTGEKVTYLAFTQWSLLCNDITFYDSVNGVYVNYDAETGTISTATTGNYVDLETLPDGVTIASIINTYVSNVTAYTGETALAVTTADIYAVLGIGSLRMPRLSNMAKPKETNKTGTAYYAYVPARDANDETDHVGDLVVWLGNNGRLAVDPTQGLALSKTVSDTSEETGAPSVFNFEITLTNAADFDGAKISVMDAYGSMIDTSAWSVGAVTQSGGVYTCTVNVALADGETVYIVNLPAGAVYAVNEVGAEDYYEVNFVNGTGTVVNNTFTSVTATNDAIDYADLYITKEIVHSQEGQSVPTSVLEEVFTVAVNFGTALAGKEFVLDATGAASAIITVDSDGINELTVKHGETIAIRDIPAGSEITVVELSPDAHFTAQYRSRNHSGYDADSDGTVTITADGDNSTHDAATIVITNSYAPTPVSVDMDIALTKNLDITGALTDEAHTFYFQVQEDVNGTWKDVLDTPASVSYAKGENGEKQLPIDLAAMSFNAAGTYTYQVIEVIPEDTDREEGITYDRTWYTFTVVVTDAGGALEAAVYDRNGEPLSSPYAVTFTNTYHTAPVYVDIRKTVTDNAAPARDFLFEVYYLGNDAPAVDSDGNWNYDGASVAATLYSDGAGEARYTRAYEQAGTYYYVVKEVDEGKTGWTYDSTVYELQVVVTEAADGSLTANIIVDGESKDSFHTELTFENTYVPLQTTLDLDIIPTVSKVLNGRELTVSDAFTFYVYKEGDRTEILSTGTIGEKQGDAYKVVFDKVLTFTKAGTYYFDILEKNGGETIDGITYDPTVYDMVVEVVDDNGELKATYFFEDAVSQTVTFTNVYNVTGTATLNLSGTKTLTGRALAEGEFTFRLVGVDESGTVVRNITTANHSDHDGDGIGAIIFPTITYTAEHMGHTYTYTISEDDNGSGGIEYDKGTYTITVEVKDNGQGGITLDIQGEELLNALNFANTYKAESTSAVLTGIKNMLGGRPLNSGDFRFDVYEGTTWVTSGTNEGENIVFEEITYGMSDVGLHTYEVVERQGSLPGVTYDKSSYTVTVNVVDDGKGQLHAYVTYVDGALDFTNIYTRENAEVNLSGTKVLTGRDLQEGEFTFGIYRADADFNVIGDALREVTNNADGSFSFGNGVFSAPGTYYYVVTETAGDLGGVRYDPTKYHITVEVKDNVEYDGKMSVDVNIEIDEEDAEEIVFNNQYDPSGKVDIAGRKELENGTLTEDMFTFELYAGTDLTAQPIATVTNADDGTILFKEIPLSEAKVHTFTVVEKIPTNRVEGMIYDRTAYTVTVEVTDNLDGTLTAGTPVYSIGTAVVEEMVFTNSIHDILVKEVVLEQSSIKIDEQKVEKGDVLEYTITYTNTTGQVVDVVITDTIPAHTAYVENSAGDGVYDNGVLTWTLNDVAADAIVTVSFKVKVTADTGTVENQAQVREGTNTYKSNETSNPITKDEVEKDVALAAAPDVSIDGEQVKVGDILQYTITYHNEDDAAATVKIIDAIPAHTTLVENSAGDAEYASGVLTWTVNVGAGQSETVSFQVKVDAPDVFINNKASALEGDNEIFTDVVTNHTFEEIGGKDVALADKPAISIDGQMVQVGQILEYTIDYTNTTAQAVDVTITDVIPAYTKLVDAKDGSVSGDTITWELKGVQPQQTVIVTFRVEVTDPGMVIENQAQIFDGTSKLTNKVTNSVPVKAVDKQTVSVGDVLEYTISYTNTTGAEAKLVITDKLHEALTLVEGTQGNGVYADGTITWTVENVPDGETVTVSFRAKVTAAGEISNTAQVFENDVSAVVTNETITEAKTPELSVKKEQSVAGGTAATEKLTVKKDSEVTYIITVTNSGEGDAYDLTVTDKLPEGLVYVENSVNANGTVADGIVTWTVDELKAGESVQLTVTVIVPSVEKTTVWKNVATVVDNNAPDEDKEVTSNEVELEEEPEPKPVEPTEPTVPPTETEGPDTGDSFNPTLFIGLMILSSFGVAAVLVCKKREEETQTAE